MPKGYVIAQVDIHDPEEYARYTTQTGGVIAEHGGRFIVRAGRREALEGAARERVVVIEFPDYDTARRFYESETYRAILPHALAASARDFMIVEGVED
jgi:uncharacterized protein (DUF1330 family)